MSFINNKTSAFIYAKLTDTGRKLLSQGALTYDYWVFGDSEIDYGFSNGSYTLDKNIILAPKDQNSNIKYPISSTLSGSPFNSLPAITPIQQVITNVAQTRGFFTGSTQILIDKYKASGTTTTTFLTGGTALGFTINRGLITNGDILMLNIMNPQQSGATVSIPDVTSAVLFYQIQSLTAVSGSTVVTVDRTLPNFGSGSTSIQAYTFPSGDTINTYYGSTSTFPYWNDNTLSFNTTNNVAVGDVPVWNYTAVFSENIAGINPSTYEGINTFSSIQYTGFKEYLNYTSNNPTQKSIGIIHYSNNNISNNYGEELVSGTFMINLPSVLWHKSAPLGGSGTGTDIGVILSGQTVSGAYITTNSTQFNTTAIPFNLPYDNLVDINGNIVGKVFYTLKLAVIEDEELVVALSFKSNRNWTLPTINGSFVAAVSENQGLIPSNYEAHVTYLLANESGFGFTTGLHCQNYQKISRGGVSQNNIKLNFPLNQLPYLKTTYDSTGGFTSSKLYILVQTTLIGQRPSPTSWKKIDVTSQINGYSSGYINPNFIENSSFVIDLPTYTAAPTYDITSILTMPTVSQTQNLQFGSETFAFANINTQIQATAYKSSFIFSAPAAQFNNTVNPTFNVNVNTGLYISEVGVYNSLNQMVAIGKLANPVSKTSSDTIQIQLDIDF